MYKSDSPQSVVYLFIYLIIYLYILHSINPYKENLLDTE